MRNFISGEKAGFVGIDNPVYKLSDFVADKVSQSNLAKSEIGKCLGLDKVDVYQVINTTAVVCITYGPDIVKAIEGRISGKQLFKNSAVATASLGAGKFAVAVAKNVFGVAGGVPGAIVSILGGMFGGYAAKRILDNYIQDEKRIPGCHYAGKSFSRGIIINCRQYDWCRKCSRYLGRDVYVWRRKAVCA